MKISLMNKSIIYFITLVMLISIGCSTVSSVKLTPTPTLSSTPVFTPTPERIKLINGELEACLLLSSGEVETISGMKVSSEKGFKVTPEKVLMPDPTVCRYVLENNGEVLVAISVTTDTTLKKENRDYSAAQWYQMMKMVDKDMAGRDPKLTILQDIEDLGDQAYSKSGPYFRIDINVLKNGVLYWFSTGHIEDGGIGYDALHKLATIALQRAP
jgi:hypothetical protein